MSKRQYETPFSCARLLEVALAEHSSEAPDFHRLEQTAVTITRALILHRFNNKLNTVWVDFKRNQIPYRFEEGKVRHSEPLERPVISKPMCDNYSLTGESVSPSYQPIIEVHFEAEHVMYGTHFQNDPDCTIGFIVPRGTDTLVGARQLLA